MAEVRVRRNKLSEEDERKLVVDYQDGFRPFELVDRYGISSSTVFRILADNRMRRTQGGHPTKPRKQLRKAASKRPLKPCGTNAAYARHINKGEKPCLPCYDAHAQNQADWMQSKKEKES